MKKLWRYWARALGEKVGETNKDADWVAIFRTFIVFQAVVCNAFIIWNILRNL